MREEIKELLIKLKDANHHINSDNTHNEHGVNFIIKALEAEIEKDGELLDNVDKIDVFHIDKHPEDGILMCLCEQNHKEIRADNIRDLFNQAMEGESQ